MTIKELRIKAGIKQLDLAIQLGVSQGAVSQWEVGITKPKSDLLPKLAKILNCSIDELLEKKDQQVIGQNDSKTVAAGEKEE